MEAYQVRTLELTVVTEAEGIAYRPDLIRRQPNTLDCHRLIHWASNTAIGDMSAMMEQRLMELFLRDGEDLTDIEVQIRAAEECGLDPIEIRQKLHGDDDVETVVLEARAAASQGLLGCGPDWDLASWTKAPRRRRDRHPSL